MTHGSKKILIIARDSSDEDEIRSLLEGQGEPFLIHTAESSLQALDMIYSAPPNLVIINQSLHEEGWKDLCKRIKADTVFGHLPIVLVLQDSGEDFEIDWEDLPVDDYLQKPLIAGEIRSRVSMVFARTARMRDANPLTNLPGNYSIMTQIQGRIDSGSPFVVAYVDLDHFKSYNDRYGFLRGDEILKMTAHLLTNSVRKLDSPDAFVGHVGGDDFVFIVPPDRLDDVCQEIIGNFDLIVENFYDEGDRTRGCIDSTNRKGEKERFPFVSISIAVVTNEHRPIKHIGQVSAIAAEVKKHAKSMEGSNYYKDMRGEEKCLEVNWRRR
ncbi:MAG: diguanylate cyclase [Deltaproteobacteria bacterium]|nr:diguanylate cyclase [Deltaproteobacteria bacterium]